MKCMDCRAGVAQDGKTMCVECEAQARCKLRQERQQIEFEERQKYKQGGRK